MMKKSVLVIISTIFICLCARAQRTNNIYYSYIDQYAGMAIDQMNRHGIPASITLAQGLLESAAGRSTLATMANNHFGIKTGGYWQGPYVLRDDDKPNERFRKYESAAESFEDHSLFLKKPRYAMLFKGDIKDYKYWAKGLKQCGYATSPTYAEKLIDLIEAYKLYEYDNGKAPSDNTVAQVVRPYGSRGMGNVDVAYNTSFFTLHPIAINNKNYYLRVVPGDTWKSISEATGVSERKLRRYNELPKKFVLQPGMVIYLQGKRSHADKGFKKHPHVVTAGQSIYDISQMYGVKMKNIYKMNKLPEDYQPKAGDVLRVY